MYITKSFEPLPKWEMDLNLDFEIVPFGAEDLFSTDTFDFATIDVPALDTSAFDGIAFAGASPSSSSYGFSSVSVSAFAAVGNDGTTVTSVEVDTIGNAYASVDVTALGGGDVFDFG